MVAVLACVMYWLYLSTIPSCYDWLEQQCFIAKFDIDRMTSSARMYIVQCIMYIHLYIAIYNCYLLSSFNHIQFYWFFFNVNIWRKDTFSTFKWNNCGFDNGLKSFGDYHDVHRFQFDNHMIWIIPSSCIYLSIVSSIFNKRKPASPLIVNISHNLFEYCENRSE